ncbi:DUF3883 domain-containing protein [Campylobacter upsaliensis]
MEFEAFKHLVSSFLIKDYELKQELSEFLDFKLETSFIKRIAIGKAAENYFLQNFKKHFEDFNVLDVREFGCGFDFKLTLKNQQICVEVKGLNENKGQFLLTQKEFEMADKLKENYCLFIVRNLKEKPKESLFFHPLNHFKLKEQNIKIVQKSYQGVL